MRTMTFPTPNLPTKLKDTNFLNYDFELSQYDVGIKRSNNQYFDNQDSNSQANKIGVSHYALSMISKLKTMAGWIKVQEEQDGMGQIKLVNIFLNKICQNKALQREFWP